MKEPQDSKQLLEHMLTSYFGLRLALSIIGIGLPIILWGVGGLVHKVGFEPSLSRYYHTPQELPALATRDVFVGGLIAAAFCLFAYRGYSNRENTALNVAAVFALGVALFPSRLPGAPATGLTTMHYVAAVAFFVCIAYVSFFCSKETLALLQDETSKKWFGRAYDWTGAAMVFVAAFAVIAWMARPSLPDLPWVAWLETAGMIAFGAFWSIKTWELNKSDADRATVDQRVTRDASGSVLGAGELQKR